MSSATVTALLMAWVASACSPEADRVRDGGPGADPGNRPVARVRIADPGPADTTLWPGRAATPLERLEAGTMHPPPSPRDH